MEVLVDSLVQISFRITSVLTRVGAEHDMSLTQMRMLGILDDRRVRVTDLAAHMGLDKSTLSGLIDRAERRGLVRRERHPGDGRAIDVLIDAAGLELAQTDHLRGLSAPLAVTEWRRLPAALPTAEKLSAPSPAPSAKSSPPRTQPYPPVRIMAGSRSRMVLLTAGQGRPSMSGVRPSSRH